jgi:diguanylate cyclase (GGDEF)-like protein
VLKPSPQINLLCAQYLFKSALSANITVIAAAAVISVFYYDDVGSALILWIVLMCAVASTRIIISKYFFLDQANHFRNHSVKFWVNMYIATSLACGLSWASLVFFIPATIDPINISILYIIFFSTMAAAITALPVILPAYFAYTTPVFLAAFLFPLFIPSRETLFLSLAAIVYFVFIIVTGRLLNKRYIQNFCLLIENEELISKLHDEIIQKELAQNELINNQQALEKTVEIRTKELSEINAILVSEINERRRIESNLKHLAHHDALTNLPNRLLLDARLNHAIERAKRGNLQVAVMFIDLDHFKTINDSLGHDVGDKLLVSISRRLLNCVREDDTVARLGGDEFIIIIEQVHDIGDLDSLLKKIMKVTSETISIDDHDLTTSASIGISIYPDDGKTADQLMRNADASMYHSKEHGRHKYHFYTRELTTTAYDRVILETDLKNAIRHKQLRVYYQPQISLQTKQIVGVEALVRWQHPDLGLLPPKQFLHIAEKSGLINKIGEMVLTSACQQIVQWKKQGLPIETIAVNVAGKQIHHNNLVGSVKHILEKTKCKTDWLELEITEDFIINKTQQAISTLQQLRDFGISLAIDDFGTGYSSLSYLKQLPVNKLKIDRSFVRDISDDSGDAALVQAIIAMAKSLQLKLVAEGVENGSHESFLIAHGCEYAQGFYYSKPIPADEIEKLFYDKSETLRKNIKLIKK